MRIARLLAAACLLASPAMIGCGYAATGATAALAARRPAALLDQVALVVPIPEGQQTYVATPWHRARLTIGRFDGSMAELTHTYVGGRYGLEPVGAMPPLEPGDDYWIRMELIQDGADGAEHIVGRAWAGEEDAPLTLNLGPNAARLDVRPTLAGTTLALTPTRVPSLAAEDRWPSDYQPTYAAPRRPDVEEPDPDLDWAAPAARDVDYDDRPRARHESVDLFDYATGSDDDGYDYEDGGSSSSDDDADGASVGDVTDSGLALQPRNPIER